MRGSPWLHLSSLGIGTYLGDEDAETDAMVKPPAHAVVVSNAEVQGANCWPSDVRCALHRCPQPLSPGGGFQHPLMHTSKANTQVGLQPGSTAAKYLPARSVNRGWNCIDTASNYRSGRAEEAVGYALLALRIANVGITRNMLFVSCAHPHKPVPRFIWHAPLSGRRCTAPAVISTSILSRSPFLFLNSFPSCAAFPRTSRIRWWPAPTA